VSLILAAAYGTKVRCNVDDEI